MSSAELERAAASITRGPSVVSGLLGSAKALVVSALQRKVRRPFVIVSTSNRQVEALQNDLEVFCAAFESPETTNGVVVLPGLEADPYDGMSPHAEVLEERALALHRIIEGRCAVLLTSVAALAERTVAPITFRSSILSLARGDEMPLELIVDLLLAAGYVRQEPVGAVGEFSLRGGILDVFSPAHEAPHRIEFFGDTVDSLREFDPDSQRSTTRLQSSLILPMREVQVRREDFLAWADAARERWSDEKYARDLRARIAHAERGESFPGWEFLLPLTTKLSASAFDYLTGAVFVIDEPVEIERRVTELYRGLRERFAAADEAGEVALQPFDLFLSPDELRERFEASPRVDLRLLGRAAASVDQSFGVDSLMLSSGDRTDEDKGEAGSADAENRLRALPLFPVSTETPDTFFQARPARRFEGRVNELAGDIRAEVPGRLPVTSVLAMPSLGLAERVVEMLAEYGVTVGLRPTLATRGPLSETRAIATVAGLGDGFLLPAAGLSFLTEGDIFGEIERPPTPRRPLGPARKRRRASAFLSDLSDLKVGDFVVHVDHGIGRFEGLVQMTTAGVATGNVAAGLERSQGSEREFMLLTYADAAKLYVPVERLDLVQRYSAGEGPSPNLDRLGGIGWQKTKARAKRAMRDMAEELLKLYAERRLVKGYSYDEDTPWQQEFEDAFPYELTTDQEGAIGDVKSDMVEAEPMDRLIVGDVGYGKTEVAMRAAFKAVMDGKQVAVLAPTTVLVFQHYKTFQDRFSAFPVRIEMLSRFRTAKEQKRIVAALEEGALDIVIGTHRLLSKDIRFKDLGLLVVDEEQRFGVAHKERIKHLRKRVDVISMSATPIPRTLNMSLAGLRDMSVIETPPRDRLAIQTHVVQFSESVVRSAIELELQRSGQVFFIHNRVETIYSIAELVGRIVPEARLGVAHGQMGERDLEDVVLKFIRHELDVLVSTTIIENGIDIPLANTIIINRADMYGLSQLYQLRGRVGRSNRRAYAYLLIPSEESLTEIARKRLAAIREFSDLGAGFRIAALDLELRGAGNLLGGEQSGHIESIGFDLYTRMLERTVRELKGEPVEDELSTAVNLGVDIRIPAEYVNDVSQRLRTYKRVSSAESDEELADIRAEIEDRYGPLSESVESLFDLARLRREASKLGVISIDREGERLALKFSEKSSVDPDRLIAMVSGGEASFSPSGVLRIGLATDDDSAVMDEVRALLRELGGGASTEPPPA